MVVLIFILSGLTLPLQVYVRRDYQLKVRNHQKQLVKQRFEAIRLLESQDYIVKETEGIITAYRKTNLHTELNLIEIEGENWYEELLMWLDKLQQSELTDTHINRLEDDASHNQVKPNPDDSNQSQDSQQNTQS